MHNQPKFYPQRGSEMYADGRSARPQVIGTVARSQTEAATYFATGMVNGAEADGMPFRVTPVVLLRGQERYNVYCTPCHTRVGNGKGKIVERGYYPAATFHSYRLREAPLGHFFNVITHGYGAMPDYAAQLSPQDRWAVVAYIRALQLSQGARETDVQPGERVTPLRAVLERTGYTPEFLGDWVASDTPAARPAAAAAAAAPATAAATPTAPSAAGTAAAQPQPAKSSATPGPLVASATAPGKPGTATAKPGAAQEAGAAPAKAPAAAADKGDAVHGKAVYAANCSMCHQPTRAGMPPVFPSLIGIVEKVGEKRVRTVAVTGIPEAKPPMPPHPDLTSKDLDDLLAFLKTKP